MESLAPAIPPVVTVMGLLGGLFWMLARGDIVTRREADAITKRAEAAERRADAEATRAAAADKRVDKALHQVDEMTEMARLGQNLIRAAYESES